MRISVALLVLVSPIAALAAPGPVGFPSYEVRVTRVEAAPGMRNPSGDAAWVDFGPVSNTGGAPRTGTRYALPNGDAVYVTTVELIVSETKEVMHTPGPPVRSRPAAVSDPLQPPRSHTALGSSRGPDLYAWVQGPPIAGVGVIIAPAGTTDWTRGLVQPAPIGPQLVASAVMPGDPIRVDVAMVVASSASGQANASVTFEAR